jgi:hypothetical protein
MNDNVKLLNGLYVAQPGNGLNGTFSTCVETDFCASQLVVRGVVIAQQFALNRAHGTLGPLDDDANGLCSPFPASDCPPAEVFIYEPSMLVGQPVFSQNPTGIEGMFELPPVF